MKKTADKTRQGQGLEIIKRLSALWSCDYRKGFEIALDWLLGCFCDAIHPEDHPMIYAQEKGQTGEARDLLVKMLYDMGSDAEEGQVDYLGHIYETLELNFGKSGQFYTPFTVAQLASAINGGAEHPITFYADIAGCGSGRMLLAMLQRIRDSRRATARAVALGVDLDPTSCKMAAINLALHSAAGLIITGDGLTPQGQEAGEAFNWQYGSSFYEVKISPIETGAGRRFVSRITKIKYNGQYLGAYNRLMFADAFTQTKYFVSLALNDCWIIAQGQQGYQYTRSDSFQVELDFWTRERIARQLATQEPKPTPAATEPAEEPRKELAAEKPKPKRSKRQDDQPTLF